MRIIYRYYIIAVALLCLMSLESCQRTELCYEHYPSLTFGLEWEHEWERDYGMSHFANWDGSHYGFEYDEMRPVRPEWVNVVVNRADGTTTEKLLQPNGGKISVDFGAGQSYLLYNGDTEYILFSDMASLADARATSTTRTRAGMAYITERHPDVRSINPPDVLYAAYVDNKHTYGVHDHPKVDVRMQPLVFTYVIRYEFEAGIEKVSLARGAIGGMAESVYMRDGKTSDETAVILYDCEVKPYGCEAKVRTFGVPGFPDEYYGQGKAAPASRPYSLNLEVMLRNGETVEFNYDITDQLKNQPRGGVITVKGLKIDEEKGEIPPTESGFNADVNDWPAHDIIDLPMVVVF